MNHHLCEFAKLTFSVVLVLATAQGQTAPKPTTEELEAIEQEIEAGQAVQERLEEEKKVLDRTIETVRSELVALARRVQDREYSLLELEERLEILEAREETLQQAVDRRDTQMQQLLMALERLALRPSDAVILQPRTSADAVRSAILLRTAVPEVRKSAMELKNDLAELQIVRISIITEQEKISANAKQLLSEQKRLGRLHAEKGFMQKNLIARSSKSAEQNQFLAQSAKNLRDLLEKLKTARTKPVPPQTAVSPKIRIKDSSKSPTEQPSFNKARGSMPYPVAGQLTTPYGNDSDSGNHRKGITIATRGGASVLAVYDGVIAFSGPFRGYGELLIIEHSEGYHSLLAGMSRIESTVGQRVFAGEPVGVMEQEGSPSLYVELRRDGEPINPLPWLTARIEGSKR